MNLTREILLARRRELEADAYAINGAIQQVDWDLEKLEEEEAVIDFDKMQEVGATTAPASGLQEERVRRHE